MKNIYQGLYDMMQPGSGLVLATVTRSLGSTPQKPGSSAIFKRGKLVAGTVGGGVAEARVGEEARICSSCGKSEYLHLFLDSDISNREEAICGGELFVLVDARPENHKNVFEEVSKSIARREPGILVMVVKRDPAESVSVSRYWMTRSNTPSLPNDILDKIGPEASRILDMAAPDSFYRLDLSQPEEKSSEMVFVEPVFPKPKLIIAGAGHVGKAVSHMGRLLDFEVTVIDDRSEFANPSNLPDADHIVVKNPGEAIAEAEKSQDTFIVIVTRGHKDDAEALKPCIGSGVCYTGMIGSKAKVAKMKKEFVAKGYATPEQWADIHTPIGLDIKSQTVEEIAVSIAAELVLVRNKGKKR